MRKNVDRFVVCLHDVAPTVRAEVERQLAELYPLVGSTVAAAVIPAGAGFPWRTAGREFIERMGRLDLLLHGFKHHRPFSPSCISLASGLSDELVGLDQNEILYRLSKGQHLMAELFGHTVKGFLPPAWRRGTLRLKTMARAQMSYLVGFDAVTSVHGQKIPLSTYSWDWGPLAVLGQLGTMLGRVCQYRSRGVPVVALHPCDEQRGHLQPALIVIKRFLDRGFKPVTFSQLLESHS